MEFLTNNLTEILLVAGAVYPPLLFLLPVKYAKKIDLVVKLIKTIADGLEKAKNTKSGLSIEDDSKPSFYQKTKV